MAGSTNQGVAENPNPDVNWEKATHMFNGEPLWPGKTDGWLYYGNGFLATDPQHGGKIDSTSPGVTVLPDSGGPLTVETLKKAVETLSIGKTPQFTVIPAKPFTLKFEGEDQPMAKKAKAPPPGQYRAWLEHTAKMWYSHPPTTGHASARWLELTAEGLRVCRSRELKDQKFTVKRTIPWAELDTPKAFATAIQELGIAYDNAKAMVMNQKFTPATKAPSKPMYMLDPVVSPKPVKSWTVKIGKLKEDKKKIAKLEDGKVVDVIEFPTVKAAKSWGAEMLKHPMSYKLFTKTWSNMKAEMAFQMGKAKGKKAGKKQKAATGGIK